jgi:hypothetical protein
VNRSTVLVSLVVAALAGCDSIVGGRCPEGMFESGGECRTGVDPGGPDADPSDPPDADEPSEQPDATVATGVDAATLPDAPGCTADVMNDPMNCGECGIVCATGLCELGVCLGQPTGHVVVIGHDFDDHNAAMARVIGNAAALATTTPIRIARWRGTAFDPVVTGANQALNQGLAAIGRNWVAVATTGDPMAALDTADVFVVHAQRGDGDMLAQTGAAWQPALAAFLDEGGVVIVLEGEQGTSHRLAVAAGLVDIAGITASSATAVSVVAPTDAVVTGVPSPYFASATSVWFDTPHPGVIADGSGRPIVIHVSQ